MIKLRSGNIIKHKNQSDVAFEIIGTLPSTKGWILIGHWLNVISSVPYVMAVDKITILSKDIEDWYDYRFVNKELH